MTEVKTPSAPLIDRVVGYFSPKAGAERAAWRAFNKQAGYGSRSASYRGGIGTRTSRPWGQVRSYSSGGKSVDRLSTLDQCDRARTVYRDNPIGRNLVKTEVDNVVASGFVLQAKTRWPEFNAEAEDRWEEWLEVADIRGMLCGSELQRQIYKGGRRDGDRGIILVDRGGESRLQLIPKDLICTPDGKIGKAEIADGIELDAGSRPVAFHVLDQDEKGKRAWSRIAASNFIYWVPEIDEDLQVRGQTAYGQIFDLLDQLDGYTDAVIIAARMAAIFGLIFKDDNAQKQHGALDTMLNSQGKQQAAITLENGMLKYMGADGQVVQVQAQQPMNQTPDFIRAVLRLIGLPFDMPLELVAKDMSQVNFASARIGLLGYYRACRARQKAFRSCVLDRIYRWWISREVKAERFRGAVPIEIKNDTRLAWAHKFIAEGWDYTDPVSEAQGDQLQVDMGTKTPQMVAAERGRDWEEMQEELAVARAVRRLKQLPEMHSTMTRDETVKVTAIDADGNPVSKPGEQAQPLNGAQITAAIDVLGKAREGALSDSAAAELLAQIGIEPSKATAIVSSLSSLTAGAGDVAFKREVLKALLTVPAAREVVYNATDIEDLVAQTGLNPEANYQAPFIPVVAAGGPLVSGDTIQDPSGDIVGGDVENDAPADLAEPNPANEPADPEDTDENESTTETDDDQQDDEEGETPADGGTEGNTNE